MGSLWISIHRNVCVGPSAGLPQPPPPTPPGPALCPPPPSHPPPPPTLKDPQSAAVGAVGTAAAEPPRNRDGAGEKNPLCVGSGVEGRGCGWGSGSRIGSARVELSAAQRVGPHPRVGPRPAWVTAPLCSHRGSARSEVGWRRALKHYIYISVVREGDARTTPTPRSPHAHPPPLHAWGPREAQGWGGVGGCTRTLCGVCGGGKMERGEEGGMDG